MNTINQYNRMKRALSLLRYNKSEDPHTIKTEFLKYGGGRNCNFTKGSFPTSKRIYQLSETHQF